MICNIRHEDQYVWESPACKCGNSWLCNQCLAIDASDDYPIEPSTCDMCDTSMCKKCPEWKYHRKEIKSLCTGCCTEYQDYKRDRNKCFRKKRFRNKYNKEKKRYTSKFTNKSYLKRKGDKRCNKLSIAKWNKRYNYIISD